MSECTCGHYIEGHSADGCFPECGCSDPGTAGHTLGQLQADDLGRTITVRDGGATYTGSLNKIEHSAGIDARRRTFVILRSDNWSHMKTYRSDTPCDIIPTHPAPTSTTQGAARVAPDAAAGEGDDRG